VELDAASNNSVDNIRELIDQVQIPPTEGKYRVFIIDEVHMLSSAAFNAFLKTLEEPPSYVIFILATTEKHKILPTILSRCQIYDFNRITVEDIINHLQYVAESEHIAAERAGLAIIAEKADGAMRDALSIFDQVAASSRGNITYNSAIESLNVLDRAYYSRIFECIGKQDIPSSLLIFKEIRDNGFDTHFFIEGLAKHIRSLMLASNPATLSIIDGDPGQLQQWQKEAAMFTPEFFYSAMSLVNDADLNYRKASDKTFLAELLLIKLCQLTSPFPVSDGAEEGHLKPIAVKPMPVNGVISAATTQEPKTESTAQTPQKTPQQPESQQAQSPQPKVHRRSHAPLLKDINAPRPQASTITNKVKREQPYTGQQIADAWNSYIALHPTEHILLSAIRNNVPAQEEGDVYAITIENRIQEEEIKMRLADLYSHMRNAIENDNWTLRIYVDSGEGSPETWNDREVLAYSLQNSAPLARLYDMFKLKL